MQTGTAGDMILGALFDLGLDFRAWKERMDTLGLAGIDPGCERVLRNGISATRFRLAMPREHAHRGLSAIRAIIDGSGIPQPAKEGALAVFTRLAKAEAGIHGVPVEQVHFHEVGAVDAIVDIVGACVGFNMLGIREFYTTPFTFGSGTVRAEHGTLSVPAPATLALSEGFPSRRTGLPGELCTPTGTAIISTLSKPLPSDWTGIVRKLGYGAGSRDMAGIANVLRICLMEADTTDRANRVDRASRADDASGYTVFQVECNLDNMTPELIGHAAERLLAAGCNDVWQEPIFMKKNRSGIKLCALVEKPALDDALRLIASETATGGMRYFPVSRMVAEKASESVETRYGSVALKRVSFPGMAAPRYSPEYESCRTLAAEANAPLQSVYLEALVQARLKTVPEGDAR